MAINPEEITTVRVGELVPEIWSLPDLLPHEVGGALRQGSVNGLADLISSYIGTVSSLAFNPTSVNSGETLPATDTTEWMFVGKGTFLNVGGGADIITTEGLNVLTSNGSFWALSVAIPIDVEFSGVVQTIRSGFTQTVPSENAVYDALSGKVNTGDLNTNNVINNSDVPGITVTNALNTLNSDKENVSNKQNNLNADATLLKYPTVEAVRTGKLFQDFASFSTYSGLGLDKANSGIILIGDSNAEGYNTVGVGSQNWYNILVVNLQKNQGSNSGIGLTNFSDPTRYGLTLTGTTSIVAKGPTNTAIQMTPNSEIQFTASSNLVEIWMETTPGAGSLEFYYNNVLYRTLNLAGSGTISNDHSFLNGNFPSTPTPSGDSGNYRIKCISANCTITTLFKDIKFSEGYDTYFFLRDAVAGKTFGDFDINDIKETSGLGGDINSLYLLNLGTNSIYAPSKATTSAQFGTDLTNYINGIKSTGKNIVYIMPPLTLETTFPPVLEPYINYFNVAVTVCDDLGIEMIDLNGIFNYTLPSVVFGSDGLHYSAMGHDAISKYMIHALANIDIDSRNLLQDYKANNPIPVLSGNTDYLPKKTGANTYGDSRIADDGTHIYLNNPTDPHAGGNEIQANGSLSLKVGAGSDTAAAKGLWISPAGGSTYAGFTWQLNTDSTASLFVGYSGGFNEVFRVSATGGGIKLNNLAGIGTRQVVADSSGVLSATDVAPTSGTYTPTAVAIANVTSVASPTAHTYTMVGNIVTVYGLTTPSLTSGSTLSRYTITLPIPRATGTALYIGAGNNDGAGTNILEPVKLISSSTTTVEISLTNTVTGSIVCSYSFQYDITQ